MPAQGFFNWSTTANANGSADGSINFLEGQSPASLNDSCRAAMARLREWGNDISGSIVTTGTSTAYIVSSNQDFDTLAHLDSNVVAFSPHATNGATVTLNVDGLGAKPLRSAPGVELLAGTIIAGTPYLCRFSNADGAFYLQGFFGSSPYLIPLGAGMDYWGSSTPNSSFAFPIGQQISQTTYAALYTLFGPNRYGADGGGLFFLPDKRGRVSAALDPSGTVLTSFSMSPDGNTLGAKGGNQAHTLVAGELPSSIPFTDPGHTHTSSFRMGDNTGAGSLPYAGSVDNSTETLTIQSATTGITINPSGGSPHINVQPSISCNYILRVA